MPPETARPAPGGNSLAWLPAVEMARLVRSGVVSPVELVEACLERIEQLDGRLGSFVTVAADSARTAAKEAESRVGEPDLPAFHGVPIAIKDLTDTAGIVTTRGLAAHRDRVPDVDDAVVRRIRAAGFLVLGKTTSPAVGLGCVTEPAGYPPARNPWDLTRTPGGSSGGSGAAVAAGLVPLAHGSDGGGSVRIPSSWCGLVGIKPARGRISTAPTASSFQATHGAIARTVADAAALLDVMAGAELGDAFYAPVPERPFADEVGVDPGRLRVAVATDGRDLDPGVAAALAATAETLAAAGHAVVEAEPPSRWSRLIEDGLPRSGGPGLARIIDSLPHRDELDPLLSSMAEFTAGISAEAFAASQGELQAAARAATEFFADHDVLLTPTVAKAPPEVGQHREMSVVDLFLKWESYVPFTTMWNWTGQPAISVPAGLDESGLPIGMQLIGHPYAEATIIRVAAQLEQAHPWAHLRPSVS